MSKYQTYTTEELLAAIETAGRTPDLDLIHTILDGQADVTPGLLYMFHDALNDDWENEDDPRWYRLVHAGMLLLAFREEAALPVFHDLYLYHEDWLEWFETDPYYFGPAAIDTFAKVARTDTGPEWHFGRALATGVLGQIGLHFPEAKEETAAALRAMLPPLRPDGTLDLPDDVEIDLNWTNAIGDLAYLRDVASRPQIEALFDAGYVDEMFIDKAYYLSCLEGDGLDHRRHFDIIAHYEHMRDEAERAHERAEQEARRKQREEHRGKFGKVGRNEPCPCGSGKKYKRCHGLTSQLVG
jgi:uncharacterized protein YchJ